MDNYDLSNLSLSGHCADSGEHHSWLTDEENRCATFSGRSATVSTSEQVERQQLLSTGDEQISEQRALADFDMSLASNILEPLIVDDPENPFAALAAYQSLTFEDDPRHPFDSELDFFEGFSAESLPDVVLAEPEGNDFLELSVRPEQLEPPMQPKQSQDEPDAKGISIPESANSDTVSGKRSDQRSRKRRAPEPRSSIKESIDLYFHKSSSQSDRLTIKRQKPDVTKTEFLPLPPEIAARSHSFAMPEKSADSQKNTEQNPDESLEERVKKETAKWVRFEPGVKRRFVCSYPNCGSTHVTLTQLKRHIFIHISISIYKCTYPECSNKPYFRDSLALQRHVQSHHTHEKPYHCTLCDRHFARSDTYKRHMRNIHKMSL